MIRTESRPTSKHSGRVNDRRWAAVLARDARADGTFVFSVATTRVYCRPSCPARRPRRENVAFHETCRDAERAGFRACKRCGPDQGSLAEEQARKVAAACRLIESEAEPPTLAVLARKAGMSPFHFHRIFKAVVGVSPKAYAVAHRRQRVGDTLKRSKTVTEAIFEAGFNSSGRFYAGSDAALGMSPSNFRDGGKNTELRFAVGTCSLGSILVAASAKGVAAILIGDDPRALLRELEDRFPRAKLVGGDKSFEGVVAKVLALAEAPGQSFDLPLDIRGTAFQQRVWTALRAIPPGSTATYSEIAERIGQPGSARAVARACATNNLAIIIPCHRVVRTDGSLSGYRWGIGRKRALLDREKRGR